MKKIILGVVVLGLAICSCQQITKTDTEDLKKKIVYFKDPETGLCFGAVNSYSYGFNQTTSITCVPCDSLKNVEANYQLR